MSKCMTIVDEPIDQKEITTDITAKSIVEFILEEAVVAAVIYSDKGCSCIGDFSISEDFCQQFDQIPAYSKEIEIKKLSQNPAATNQELKLESGESIDGSISLLTAKENLDIIRDSFIKKEEKVKNFNDCKIISEEVLANNELRIENGQIHLEKNSGNKSFLNIERFDYFDKEDVIKDEKIEIEYYNDGKLNKIYVPFTTDNTKDLASDFKTHKETKKLFKDYGGSFLRSNDAFAQGTEKPFSACTTEDFRQVWESANASIVEGWNMSAQSEEVARLMGELSSAQMLSETSADPNRPRACAFAEKDVNKMTKEIEEINFNQTYSNFEDFTNLYRSDGKGDADLESKSINLENSLKDQNNKETFFNSNNSADELKSQLKKSEEEMEGNAGVLENKLEVLKKKSVEDTKSEMGISNESKSCVELRENNFSSSRFERKEKISDDSHFYPINYYSSDSSQKVPIKTIDSKSYTISTKASSPKSWTNVPSDSSWSKSNFDVYVNTNEIKLSENNFFDKNNETLRISDSNMDSLSFVKAEKTNEAKYSSYNEIPIDPSLHHEHLSTNILLTDIIANNSNYFHGKQINPSSFSYWNDSINEMGRVVMSETNELNVVRSQKGGTELHKNILSNAADNDNKLMEFNDGRTNLENRKSEESSEDIFQRFQVESANDMVGFLEKEIEVSLPESDSNCEKMKEKFSKNVNKSMLSSVSSLSNQSESESVEIKKFQNTSNNSSSQSLPFSNPAETIVENSYLGRQITENTSSGLNNTLNSNSYTIAKNKDEIKETAAEDFQLQNSENPNQNDIILNDNSSQVSEEKKSNKTQPSETSFHNDSSDESEGSHAFPTSMPEKFKLHSRKMYPDVDLYPPNQRESNTELVNSEEAFIDLMENVIQIIDPAESSNDEESNNVSFSLLNEVKEKKSVKSEKEQGLNAENGERSCTTESIELAESTSEHLPSSNDQQSCSLTDDYTFEKKTYSGMTTIGPIKNVDYDPKDLTSPDIDFGKMTRISSSRQLTKDLFSPDKKSTSSINTTSNSEHSCQQNTERIRVEAGSFVNRDIASLTKVQKIREVMSYHPKSHQDFEDENTLSRPRLDLKDVESTTYDRFKVPDVSIPLLSFEVSESSSEANKDVVENIHLVLSRNCFNESHYYADDNNVEDSDMPNNTDNCSLEFQSSNVSQNEEIVTEKESASNESTSLGNTKKKSRDSVQNSCNESPSDSASNSQKYGTLGSVFKKASTRFIQKEGDLFLRNSKSLPRDPSKILTTESIKSILDDCHSSATNMLKKSRSLLKNTQSIFKTLSQNRFNTIASTSNFEKQKSSPSVSDLRNPDRKISFIKKEDLTKAKNIIKSKVQKTFKSTGNSPKSESGASLREKSYSMTPDDEPTVPLERKDFIILEGNDKNYKMNPIENTEKLIPKSSLVYKSQFVKSQINVLNDSFENIQLNSGSTEIENSPAPALETSPGSINVSNQKNCAENLEPEVKTKISRDDQKELENIKLHNEKCYLSPENQTEYEHLDFIVMETVQGLPTPDLENPPPPLEAEKVSFAERVKVEDVKGNNEEINNGKDDLILTNPPIVKISNDTNYENTIVLFEEKDSKQIKKTGEKTKNSKFSTRLRSFWCAAFGKVKTSPNKKEKS